VNFLSQPDRSGSLSERLLQRWAQKAGQLRLEAAQETSPLRLEK
jgi:hypothetical protein